MEGQITMLVDAGFAYGFQMDASNIDRTVVYRAG